MSATPFLTEEAITETLDELNSGAIADVAARQKRCGKHQPELTAFVVTFTIERRPEAAGVALFVMLVLYEAFRSAATKMAKAHERVVLRHWHAARDHTERLRLQVDSPRDLLDDIPASSEPAALEYVVEALLEETDDGIQLTDDEVWHFYAVLRATIETLHEQAAAPRTIKP